MAANVHSGGLGFEKLFRRKSRKVERSKDDEKKSKNLTEDGDVSTKDEKEENSSKIGKLLGQKQAEDKNDTIEDSKSSAKEIDQASSQKTNESKKSSKKKQSESSPESVTAKEDDKLESPDASGKHLIKDGVGQVNLTEIINNSIKEAVRNIVKEGVCPLADSLDLRAKDAAKKLTSSTIQENQDKENKPASPKHLPSLISGANKTFDSHLCRSQRQQSSPSLSPSSGKFNDQNGKITVNRCVPALSPRVGNNRKSARSVKRKDKSLREPSPKICRQNKGQSSHFRTDNRRMTGNVNIYICSEANENTKDKPKTRNKDRADDSQSATSSSLSVSTSKLVAALRKKQRKNLANQSLSCVCDIPQNSVKQYKSNDKIANDDDISCLGNEDVTYGDDYPDGRSSLSKDPCSCDDAKSSDVDFSVSDEASLDQACCSSSASGGYTLYDQEDYWSARVAPDRASYDDSDGSEKFDGPNRDKGDEKNIGKRCSSCNLRKCKDDRPTIGVPCPRLSKTQPERRKSRDKGSRVSHDVQQFSKCLCIVEEVDEDGGNERKKSEVKLTPSTDEEHGNDNNGTSTVEPEKSASNSASSDITKNEKNEAGSPTDKRKKSVPDSEISSMNNEKTIDQPDEANVKDVDTEPKPQSPKPTLLSAWRKSFTRSSGTEEADRTKNITGTEENRRNSESSKNTDNADDKRRDSFFYRSMKRAMSIVKSRKDDDVVAAVGQNENTGNDNSNVPAETTMNDNRNVNVNGEDKNNNFERRCDGMDKDNCNFDSSGNSKQDKKTRSRIGTAIESRRSITATSNESSNADISCRRSDRPANSSAINDPTEIQVSGKKMFGCKCGKASESFDCRCEKPEPTKEETCACSTKCKTTKSGDGVDSEKLASPPRESRLGCKKCGNSAEICVCRCKKMEPIESDRYECPECSRPIPECKCRFARTETTDRESCDCCRRPKRLCRCVAREKIRTDKSPMKKYQSHDNRTFSNWKCPKSMICIYCDKPQNDCICNAPIRKCSQCGLPLDVCNCNPSPCRDCSGRQIVPNDDNDRSTFSVTAWKPRRSVRRYFAREPNAPSGNSDEDCPCYEKPYGSDGLPYQKGAVFSDVMSELQQKMSDSVCCNDCRKVPCDCCCAQTEEHVERRTRKRLSSIAEKRSIRQSDDRSRSKSPVENCRCGTPRKNIERKSPAAKICDRCNTSPCRCRRSSASPRKKPSAKCYYCKSSPCTCAPMTEPINPRPFRKIDSSHRRRKERNSTEEHVTADIRSDDNNGRRGRDSSHVVPCPERQQPRKYCYRENPTGQHSLKTGERVR